MVEPSEVFGRGPRSRILLIDDSMSVRKGIERTLKSLPVQILGGSTGAQGMDLLAKFRFGLFICDLVLPDRDGLDLCREAKSHWPEMSVLLISGLVDDETKRKGQEAGADAILRKPFSKVEFLSMVEDLLKGSAKKASPPLSFKKSLLENSAIASALEQLAALTALRFILLSRNGRDWEVFKGASSVEQSVVAHFGDLLKDSAKSLGGSGAKDIRGVMVESGDDTLFLHNLEGQGYVAASFQNLQALGKVRFLLQRLQRVMHAEGKSGLTPEMAQSSGPGGQFVIKE